MRESVADGQSTMFTSAFAADREFERRALRLLLDDRRHDADMELFQLLFRHLVGGLLSAIAAANFK